MTPQEKLRKQRRTLSKIVRELDTQAKKMKQQEDRLVTDIKNHAKKNEMGAAKIKAKDLVRTKKHRERFMNLQTQIQLIEVQLQVRFRQVRCVSRTDTEHSDRRHE